MSLRDEHLKSSLHSIKRIKTESASGGYITISTDEITAIIEDLLAKRHETKVYEAYAKAFMTKDQAFMSGFDKNLAKYGMHTPRSAVHDFFGAVWRVTEAQKEID